PAPHPAPHPLPHPPPLRGAPGRHGTPPNRDTCCVALASSGTLSGTSRSSTLGTSGSDTLTCTVIVTTPRRLRHAPGRGRHCTLTVGARSIPASASAKLIARSARCAAAASLGASTYTRTACRAAASTASAAPWIVAIASTRYT